MEALLTPVVQDVLATTLAALALIVLVRRMVRMFFTKEDVPACDGCSGCPPREEPKEPKEPNASVPLTFLRRAPSTDPHVKR